MINKQIFEINNNIDNLNRYKKNLNLKINLNNDMIENNNKIKKIIDLSIVILIIISTILSGFNLGICIFGGLITSLCLFVTFMITKLYTTKYKNENDNYILCLLELENELDVQKALLTKLKTSQNNFAKQVHKNDRSQITTLKKLKEKLMTYNQLNKGEPSEKKNTIQKQYTKRKTTI